MFNTCQFHDDKRAVTQILTAAVHKVKTVAKKVIIIIK